MHLLNLGGIIRVKQYRVEITEHALVDIVTDVLFSASDIKNRLRGEI